MYKKYNCVFAIDDSKFNSLKTARKIIQIIFFSFHVKKPLTKEKPNSENNDWNFTCRKFFFILEKMFTVNA